MGHYIVFINVIIYKVVNNLLLLLNCYWKKRRRRLWRMCSSPHRRGWYRCIKKCSDYRDSWPSWQESNIIIVIESVIYLVENNYMRVYSIGEEVCCIRLYCIYQVFTKLDKNLRVPPIIILIFFLLSIALIY